MTSWNPGQPTAPNAEDVGKEGIKNRQEMVSKGARTIERDVEVESQSQAFSYFFANKSQLKTKSD